MQGANILAASKAVEPDNSRHQYSGVTMSENRDLFRTCLKKQTRQIDQPNGQLSSSNGRGESKPGKLDRSALLKSPGSSSILAEPIQDEATADSDTVVLSAMSEIMSGKDSSQASNGDQACDEDKTSIPANSPQMADQETDSANVQAEGVLLAPVILTSMADAVPTQTDVQQAEGELTVASVEKNGLNLKAIPVDEINQPMVDSMPVEALPDTRISIPAEAQPILAQAGTSEVQSESTPSEPAASTDEKGQPAGDLLSATKQNTEVSESQVSTVQAGSSEKRPLDALLLPESNSLGLQTADMAGNQMETNPMISAPVSDNTGTTVQSAVVQETSQEVNQIGSALVANVSENETLDPASGKSKGKTADNSKPTAAGTEKANSKISLEVLKAMAGKLDESEGKNNTSVDKSADKKDTSGSELKKIMEFESGRFQAVRLAKDPGQTKTAEATADPEETVALTQTAEVKTTGEVNKALVTELTGKTPVDVKSIIDQMVQKAELTVKANSSEMKIQLEPEFLGKMTIKIALEDGLLTARFTTDNHQVKHLLENNMASLRQSLEAQGIKVEKTEVNVQLEHGGDFGGYQESRQELWQRPENPGYQNSGKLDTGGYSLGSGEELSETAFIPTEFYGIQADGSMNFVV